jgi:branched-chain amino acid transport system ATP-binding protein
MAIISVNGLAKNFGGLRAIDGIDLEVDAGEILGIIGPNGSGKTTLLNVVSGFVPPTAGTIHYKTQPISGLKPHEIAKLGMVRTFQIASVFGNLTVEENVMHASYLRTTRSLWGSLFCSKAYRRQERLLAERTSAILAFTGLERKRVMPANQLGGGEQRDLEIAIALAAEPEVLLLDEPAVGMNPEEQRGLMRLIRAVHDRGVTVILVEHNMKVIMGICSRVVVLQYGRKIAEGPPEQIVRDSVVMSAYLGRWKRA